jgi:hypothetical protein
VIRARFALRVLQSDALTKFDGRSEDPMDYRDRELGGNLCKEWEGQSPERTVQRAIPGSVERRKRGIKPDQWRVEQIIGENRKQT